MIYLHLPLIRYRDYRLAMIRHAVFGFDTFRFAAMIGELSSLYV